MIFFLKEIIDGNIQIGFILLFVLVNRVYCNYTVIFCLLRKLIYIRQYVKQWAEDFSFVSHTYFMLNVNAYNCRNNTKKTIFIPVLN